MEAATPPKFSVFVRASAVAFAVAGTLFLSEAHANLVVNGGFEDGVTTILPGFGGVAAGGAVTDTKEGNILSGWTLSGAGTNGPGVLATNQDLYFMTAAGGGPHTGDLAAVFPNYPAYNGAISQVVGTVATQSYKISFWLGNQVWDNPTLNSMTVKWGTETLLGPAAIPLAPADARGWRYFEFDRVATTDGTLLEFTGGSTSGALLLDDVVVVPEVTSFGILMGVGLLGLGSMVRLRRRAGVTA